VLGGVGAGRGEAWLGCDLRSTKGSPAATAESATNRITVAA
jgi:hypothetical protein